jgi:phosphatidylserine/phosphatidylglycerophosphate/cardiolipin synthase-like enzyme
MKLLRVLAILLLFPAISFAANPTNCPTYQVCFTPGQPCTQLITQIIAQTQKSIAVQAYSFTSFSIAKALVKAQQRGVEVKIILDKAWLADNKQNKRARAAIMYMYQQQMPLWVDYEPSIAHNKIMIIDDKRVITGSFNFTNAAEKYNAENVLIIESPVLAKQYLNNWQKRFAVSLAVPPYTKLNSVEFNQFKQQILANTMNASRAFG